MNKAVVFPNERRYRVLLENIDEGIYELDIDGNFLYFNNSLCKVFGYPPEEIQSQNLRKFMGEEHAKAAFDLFALISRTNKGLSDIVWEIFDKEGRSRVIELSAQPVADSKGEKIGFRGTARDITEKFKAQKEMLELIRRYKCRYEESRVAEKRYLTVLEFVPYPMAVFEPDGKLSYLNQAFTETFGWTMEELKGKKIPYVPPGLEQETSEQIRKLFETNITAHYETKRLTKDGHVLDVLLKASLYFEDNAAPTGEIVILRDITDEKRASRIRESLASISRALPKYRELEDLLNYIASEIKRFLNVDGASVILLDEENKELFFFAGAYDDQATQKRAREIRYPADSGVTGKVIQTGEPIIVPDTSKEPIFNRAVDERLGLHADNMIAVPLSARERMTGVIMALNKREGAFDSKDIVRLSMIASTVALSVENARYAKEASKAYEEVAILNRAKDKVINHLSHELKTPVSVLLASVNVLKKRMVALGLPEETWMPTIERSQRNLERILEIQMQVEDIIQQRHYKTYDLLTLLLEECKDELETLVADEVGEGPLVERVRRRIEEVFGPKKTEFSKIPLDVFVGNRLKALKRKFSHRDVTVISKLYKSPEICIPEDVLGKIVDGLIKNAVEATPDEGKIEIVVRQRGKGAELMVYDFGVGITEESQRRIFEGFFSTQDTLDYSSRRPFDFNAGGRGADLLRMKIFAERFHFSLTMKSQRCRYIPGESDICPGKISNCPHCHTAEDCYDSGRSLFRVFFPSVPMQEACEMETSLPTQPTETPSL